MAFEHHAVGRTDLVRMQRQRVADFNLGQRYVDIHALAPAVRNGRHALGQRRQHRGRAAHGIALQGFAAGEHQDDDRAGEVLAEQD